MLEWARHLAVTCVRKHPIGPARPPYLWPHRRAAQPTRFRNRGARRSFLRTVRGRRTGHRRGGLERRRPLLRHRALVWPGPERAPRSGGSCIPMPATTSWCRPRLAGSCSAAPGRRRFDRGFWTGGLHFDVRFDYGYDGVMRSFEDSLQRLGMPRIDSGDPRPRPAAPYARRAGASAIDAARHRRLAGARGTAATPA